MVSDKFYFCAASGQIYCYDSYRNVYAANGTLVHDGAFDIQVNELLSSPFYLDGVPYWFEQEGLRSSNVDGSFYHITTWQDEPELFDLTQLGVQGPSSQNDRIFPPNLNLAMIPTGSGLYGTPKTKDEIFSPNSFEHEFQVGSKPLMWSPTGSTSSPIVPSASRKSSQPPLFEQQSGVGLELVDMWRGDLVKIQQDATRTRPVVKPNKTDQRRCPHCNKLFRRPSSLDDHLNEHSGEKPHMCPFKGCETGFAAKSNMKRHFLNHRVGQLENYRPDATFEPTVPKTGKASRPMSTYNSKSYHNGRFRISAETSS